MILPSLSYARRAVSRFRCLLAASLSRRVLDRYSGWGDAPSGAPGLAVPGGCCEKAGLCPGGVGLGGLEVFAVLVGRGGTAGRSSGAGAGALVDGGGDVKRVCSGRADSGGVGGDAVSNGWKNEWAPWGGRLDRDDCDNPGLADGGGVGSP